MRRILAAALALVLASCASDAEFRGEQGAPPPPPPPAAKPAPAPVQAPTPPPISVPPASTTAEADTCGMSALKALIGRPRTEIPVPVDPSKRRVVCTTCPMTQDFRADRLTVLYNADTGRVTKLMCQ